MIVIEFEDDKRENILNLELKSMVSHFERNEKT